jgi:putative glycosyltransferase
MKISVVTTLYYSEKYIEEFYQRSKEAILKTGNTYEMIFVNDGSPDNSLVTCFNINKIDKNVVIINLSRNFGHHKALQVGLKYSSGDLIFLIDSDLEEDPELFNLFYDEITSDNQIDVIYGIQQKRKGGWFEKLSGAFYYKTLNSMIDIKYAANTTTARLMKRKYVESVLSFPEKEMDLWCIFALTGFNQRPIPVVKKSKGTSTYNLIRKFKIGIETLTSLTSKPLFFIFILGLIMTFISAIFIIYFLINKIIFPDVQSGYTSILVSLWFIGGMILFALGIIGIYLSKTFMEVKNRPNAIIKDIIR